MDARRDDTEMAFRKFAVGQPVRRTEDPRLLRGEGRYTDDINLPGQAYGIVVRSPYAHGVIRSIDVSVARGMPGVLAVYTAADFAAAGYGPFRNNLPFTSRDGTPMRKPPRYALASDKVRHVGDPIAFVVAETQTQARDAAEAVTLDIEPLPAVTDPRRAAAPDAPQLYDDVPGNVVLDYHYGDAERTASAFASAAHVTRLSLTNNRLVVNALEPRAIVGDYDAAAERWVVHTPSQGAFGMRAQIADILQVPAEKVHILTANVGGSFGMKAAAFPEHVCVLHAARALGRPVKWTDDRSGSFVSDSHGRDDVVEAELALDARGRFLAVRITGFANMGAHMSHVSPIMHTINFVKNVVGVYRTPAIEIAMTCVLTNTTLVSAYRGAGRPEANYFMERLIDTAAAEMNIDRIALRRRNHIRPRDLPYNAPSGLTYDSGDFTTLLDRALDVADWKGFAARRRASRKAGKLRGIGLGSYLEVTAPPSREMGGIRFEADGTVTFITGTLDYGQGHAAAFAQVLSERLGIPFDSIRLVQGDSDRLLAGGGTGGSRSIAASGSAIVGAAATVIARGKEIASHLLEAATADIDFADGRFTIAGTDRSIGLLELAARLRQGVALPEGLPRSLDVDHLEDSPPSSFPNGCHICEVEIDPDTGVVTVVSYASVNDFGTIVNPLLVEGQVHGGVAQGIGQVLLERVVYDTDGQLLTGSFMDYALPRAADIPPIGFVSHPVPASTNPLGVKGCGEAGCAGALTALGNAVVDALAPLGIRHIDLPATPERVWQAIRDARAAAEA